MAIDLLSNILCRWNHDAQVMHTQKLYHSGKRLKSENKEKFSFLEEDDKSRYMGVFQGPPSTDGIRKII